MKSFQFSKFFNKMIYIATLFSLVVLALPKVGHCQQDRRVDKLFWAVNLNKNELTFKKYLINDTKKVDITDLELWPEMINTSNPFKKIYHENSPDWKLLLLTRGFAKIKDERTASTVYINAQRNAKKLRLGMWQGTSSDDNLNQTSQKAADLNQSSQKAADGGPIDYGALLKQIKGFIMEWGGYAAIITSLIFIYNIIRVYRKRRKLFLLFLGARASGKTTLYKRMFQPSDRPEECDKPTTSPTTTRSTSPKIVPLGSYDVTPVYIDTAGGKPGEQASEMLYKESWFQRMLRPSRFVWIIILATTDKHVCYSTPDEDKIDLNFISEQLGYLYLPRGILQATDTPKPDLILLCISKFDLFSEHDPHTKFALESKTKIMTIFAPHINRLKETVGGSIPVHFEIVSACEGWRVKEIRDVIEHHVYPRNTNQ